MSQNSISSVEHRFLHSLLWGRERSQIWTTALRTIKNPEKSRGKFQKYQSSQLKRHQFCRNKSLFHCFSCRQKVNWSRQAPAISFRKQNDSVKLHKLTCQGQQIIWQYKKPITASLFLIQKTSRSAHRRKRCPVSSSSEIWIVLSLIKPKHQMLAITSNARAILSVTGLPTEAQLHLCKSTKELNYRCKKSYLVQDNTTHKAPSLQSLNSQFHHLAPQLKDSRSSISQGNSISKSKGNKNCFVI